MVIRALNRKIKRLEFKIKYKRYKFAENSFLPFIEFEAQDCKNVIVDRSVSFRQGCALRVRSSGILEIGEGTAFNNNVERKSRLVDTFFLDQMLQYLTMIMIFEEMTLNMNL